LRIENWKNRSQLEIRSPFLISNLQSAISIEVTLLNPPLKGGGRFTFESNFLSVIVGVIIPFDPPSTGKVDCN